ncbi:MAG: BMC domain-containing protein, partial [Oscillospiraceae bacterium]|nr:BMC domain-containing protein [Oscillospiraceae bacterium]
MNGALGIIEIHGLATAILVADVMVKTAAVQIENVESGQGFGWTTVKISGDVAAVNASIHAGKQVGEAHGGFVTSKVIARPAAPVSDLFCPEPAAAPAAPVTAAAPVPEPAAEAAPPLEREAAAETPPPAAEAAETPAPAAEAAETPAPVAEAKETPPPAAEAAETPAPAAEAAETPPPAVEAAEAPPPVAEVKTES